MSDTIFLNPLPLGHRDVFVQIRNTSDTADFTIEDQAKAAINKRGNRVVDNPDHAQYLLQANVLQAGKASPTAAEQAFGSGFGGGLFGAAVGATATRAATKNSSIIVGGGLIGAATDVVTGSFVKDVI